MEKRGLFVALSTLLGTTIGAGIFALPYVFAQAGFVIGLAHLVVVGGVMALVSLYLAEVVLRTKGKHQLSGLAERYLGYYGKCAMNASLLVSIYGALIAYAFGAGAVLAAMTGLPARLLMLVFFVALAIVIYFRLAVFEQFEEIFTPLKLAAVLVLTGIAFLWIRPAQLLTVDAAKWFVPYGIVLFAYTGVSVIPEMSFEVRNKKVLQWAILLGLGVSGLVYAAYSAAVIGVVGTALAEVTTISLGQALGSVAGILLNVFTLLALATAFVALGFALKENYILDYRKKNREAWVYVVAVPFLFVVTGFGGFVRVIEWTAIVGIGTVLLLILVMHHRAKKQGDRKPEFSFADALWVKGVIAVLVLAGVGYELLKLVM